MEVKKDWYGYLRDYVRIADMSCVPEGIEKVPANHIFDENQSVKWNREQVEENNKRYRREVAHLKTEKIKREESIMEDIYRAIQAEIGHNLSLKKAIAIWDYAYRDGCAYGYYAIADSLQKIMELAETLAGGD